MHKEKTFYVFFCYFCIEVLLAFYKWIKQRLNLVSL